MGAPGGDRRRWTLRARLVALSALLVTLALLAFSATGVVLIQRSLHDRADQQLVEFAGRLDGPLPPLAPPSGRPDRTDGPGDPGDDDGRPRLPTEFRVLTVDSSGVVVDRSDDDTTRPGGPDEDAVLAGIDDDRLFTVPDTGGGADWRVLPRTSTDGSTTAVAVSLASAQNTVEQLLLIQLVVGLLVVVVLGAVASVVVRIGLRPLDAIERTAGEIAAGDLDRRVPADRRTETGRLGAALNTMLERLATALHDRERSERRLRRFVADASHELRTPLTSVRGFAELYRRGGAPEREQVDRMMARIEAEALRMGGLVEDMLLLARLDEERAPELAEVDLAALAADAVHDAAARSPEHPVTLHVAGPVRVLADEDRLRQVLANLVSNALLHTPASTPVHVTVLGTASAADGPPLAVVGTVPARAALLEVRDEGPGIDQDAAPLVFDRFYRVDRGRSRASGGSGLGLAITAAVVESHGGAIELRSTPGVGTSFRVYWPAARS